MHDAIHIQEQLQEKWLIFWWALGISLLMLGVAWRRGFFKPFTSSLLPAIRGIDVLKGFGSFLLTEVLIIPLLVGLIFSFAGWNTNLSADSKGWFNLLLVAGGFTSICPVYLSLTPQQRKQLWEQGAETWQHHVTLGIMAWFVFYPIVLAFNQLISILVWHVFHHASVEQGVVIHLRQAMENPFLFWTTAFAIITLVPFTEEFLFRGLLQSWLKRTFKVTWPAVILSSVLFSIFHFSAAQGITNIELLSSLFLLSCVLGYVFERQRSLWAPIGLHSFFNLMSLLMLFLQKP